MRPRGQQNGGLYRYLHESGVLASGDPNAITAAKRRYWSQMRVTWNKEKRQRCKSFTVLLERKELQGVQGRAEQQRMSVTGFIKAAALHVAAQGALVDRATIGEVRQLLFSQYHTIERFSHAMRLPPEQKEQLLNAIRALEVAVLQALGKSTER